MFGTEFYPTPDKLIDKMLSDYKGERFRRYGFGKPYKEKGYRIDDFNILEPSAGKGNILDYLKKDTSHYDHYEVSAIESDPNLQAILREKGYPVIANDFLSFDEHTYWDLILMNPPFSNGDEHLLHAISLATKTDIVCILNAETIRNPYTNRRKQLLEIIEEHGTYEFLQEEFTEAERKTNVEIALVKLKFNNKNEKFDFDFSKEKPKDLNFDFDFENNAVARKDLVQNFQIRFDIIMKLYEDKLRNDARYDYHFGNMFEQESSYYDRSKMHLDSGTPERKYNHLAGNLKKYMWRQVIDELDVKKYMSSKVRKNFEAFIQQQSQMAFTKENVALFFQMIMNNRKNIWDEAVIDVFDVFTRYSEANRMTVPKWKTNDRYKINRKVILPYWVKWADYQDAHSKKVHGDNFDFAYSRNHEYSDIDKVLSYLSGISVYQTIDSAMKVQFQRIGKIRTGDKFDNTCESTFFKIRFHKSGTVHLYFKDKKLWDLFNMTVCAGKNWLPGSEKTKWEEEKRKRREANKPKKKPQLQLPILNGIRNKN